MSQEGLGKKYTTSWSVLAVPSAVVTLEAQRKYGFFMSWSWCHHEKKKGEKEEEEKDWSQARTDGLEPGVQICSDTLKNLLQNYMCNLWVIFPNYLFFLSPLLFCDLFYLSHFLNHKQNLFVFFLPSLFTSFAASKYPPSRPILSTLLSLVSYPHFSNTFPVVEE